jgi:alanyl-tRNA synthetase
MRATEIRKTFLDYFAQRGHVIVPSSSLIIKDDPSLLFTNAGMNQFKLVFLGQESRSYKTACSSQKCFRVSGKHNDLENVGVTPRHHTFFEMLGNFSFGDYFKQDAISYAWEFLTQTVGLEKSRLWATVYATDDEAESLWKKIAPELKDRILRFGEKENYWSMGDVGPCGPCSEIHYDLGPEFGCGKPTCAVNCDCNRYLEIWNLVFMQFNRGADGKTVPLPRPSVDTGMGFERLAAVVQGKTTNYDSDLFEPIIRALADDSGVKYDAGEKGIPHRVCADHLRGLAFTIADGGMPGNEGAGYVLRRILRRAARHGKSLGYHEPFLHRFVDIVIDVMGDAYPELRTRRDHIEHVIESEESRFAETLDAGLQRFEEAKKLAKNGVIPGVEAFKLYDTFGFPLDLTEVLARESDLSVDAAGFEAALNEQRERSRAQTGFKDQTVSKAVGLGFESKFVYDTTTLDARVLWVSEDGASVVLDQTPFYTESGGQIDDMGEIVGGSELVFAVEWMEKADKTIVHHGHVVKDDPAKWVGKIVTARVASDRRHMIQRNHTATHLLHKALHMFVGPHALQAGSLVASDRLRFDFSNPGPLSGEQIGQIEAEVNRAILANIPLAPYVTEHKKAIADGVTALFGEKYGDTVRVVKISDYSNELCGGTHVRTTGEIGLFRIVSENGVAAGVRRIEAITGEAAYEKARADEEAVKRASELLKTSPDKMIERVEAMMADLKLLRSELEKTRKKLASGATNALPIEKLDDIGVEIVFVHLSDGSVDDAKAIADQMKTRADATVAFVSTEVNGTLIISASPSATKKGLDAGKLLQSLASELGGRGGGRADFAQGKVSETSVERTKPLFLEKVRAMVRG